MTTHTLCLCYDLHWIPFSNEPYVIKPKSSAIAQVETVPPLDFSVSINDKEVARSVEGKCALSSTGHLTDEGKKYLETGDVKTNYGVDEPGLRIPKDGVLSIKLMGEKLVDSGSNVQLVFRYYNTWSQEVCGNTQGIWRILLQ
jgi:hypothetical protein